MRIFFQNQFICKREAVLTHTNNKTMTSIVLKALFVLCALSAICCVPTKVTTTIRQRKTSPPLYCTVSTVVKAFYYYYQKLYAKCVNDTTCFECKLNDVCTPQGCYPIENVVLGIGGHPSTLVPFTTSCLVWHQSRNCKQDNECPNSGIPGVCGFCRKSRCQYTVCILKPGC